MINGTINLKNEQGQWDTLNDLTAKKYTDEQTASAISTAALDAKTKADTAEKNAIDTAATEAAKLYVKDASTDGATLTLSRGDGTTFMANIVRDTPEAHNGIFRGKDLTEYWLSGDMSKAIQDGTFKDIFIGDYVNMPITVDGTTYQVKWEVAHLDYFLHSGDTECTAHHALMFPSKTIQTNVLMNTSNTTKGGFLGSQMWRVTIPRYVTGIVNAFGDAHVLSHRELLTNSISATATSSAGAGWMGSTNDWVWTEVRVNVPSEPMIYGGAVYGSSLFDVGNKERQLNIFRHKKFCEGCLWFWLQAVSSSSYFANAGSNGYADGHVAAFAAAGGGLRPYFLLR